MITAVAPHPSQPSLFISGSRDSQAQSPLLTSLAFGLTAWGLQVDCIGIAPTQMRRYGSGNQHAAAACTRLGGHRWSLPHAPLPTASRPCKRQDAATMSACALDDQLPSSLVPSGQSSNTASTTDN